MAHAGGARRGSWPSTGGARSTLLAVVLALAALAAARADDCLKSIVYWWARNLATRARRVPRTPAQARWRGGLPVGGGPPPRPPARRQRRPPSPRPPPRARRGQNSVSVEYPDPAQWEKPLDHYCGSGDYDIVNLSFLNTFFVGPIQSLRACGPLGVVAMWSSTAQALPRASSPLCAPLTRVRGPAAGLPRLPARRRTPPQARAPAARRCPASTSQTTASRRFQTAPCSTWGLGARACWRLTGCCTPAPWRASPHARAADGRPPRPPAPCPRPA